MRKASARVILPLLAQTSLPKLFSGLLVCGSASARGAGITVSGVSPCAERRRRRDHLEQRAGRVGLGQRAVDQRVVLVGVERLPGGGDLGGVVRGERRRVVRGAGGQRQDLAAARVERDDGAGLSLEPVVRGVLRGGSMVRTTLPPCTVRPVSRSCTRRTNSRSSSPDRTLSSARSMPGRRLGQRVVAGDRRVLRAAGRRPALVLQPVLWSCTDSATAEPPTTIWPRGRL